jgi:hypothetical protein
MKGQTEALAAQPREHTAAAIKIAETMTGDTYDCQYRYYSTAWGKKTVRGLADMIDNETHLRELLSTCDELLRQVSDEHTLDHHDGFIDYDYEPDPKNCPTCAWHEKVERLLAKIRKGA